MTRMTTRMETRRTCLIVAVTLGLAPVRAATGEIVPKARGPAWRPIGAAT